MSSYENNRLAPQIFAQVSATVAKGHGKVTSNVIVKGDVPINQFFRVNHKRPVPHASVKHA